MDRVLGLLRALAVWLVVAAWLVLVALVVVGLTASVGLSIDVTYFPYHPHTPIDRTTAQVLVYAVPAGLLAAVASSIAFALKRRPTASSLVLIIWAAFLIYSGWALSAVKPGPEYFERHLGARTYLISWHYAPLGPSELSQGGADLFYFKLCLNSLRGRYGEGCEENDGSQVFVSLRGGGLTPLGNLDERSWRARISGMERAEPRYGHDTYVYKPPPDARGYATPMLYHIRYDPEGRLMRLVVCNQTGRCKHHALAEDYALSYDANDSAFSMWESTDRKLSDLINSWRIR